MNLKKILLTLGVLGLMVGSCISQGIPANTTVEIIKRGSFKPYNELADDVNEIWNKTNRNFILLDTTMQALDARVVILEAGGGGGSTTFVGLTDTPSTLTDQQGKYVRVNFGATALEFTHEWTGMDIGSIYIADVLTGKSVNGVTLDATGAVTNFLNEAGGYTVPAGGSSYDSSSVSYTLDTLNLGVVSTQIYVQNGDPIVHVDVNGATSATFGTGSSAGGIVTAKGYRLNNTSVTEISANSSTNEITFKDPINGEVTLSDLLAGGGSSDSVWSSIEADTIYFNKSGYGANLALWQYNGYLYWSDDRGSGSFQDLSREIASNDINTTTLLSPGPTRDGYSIVWDNANSEFTLANVSGGGSAVGDSVSILYNWYLSQVPLDTVTQLKADTVGNIIAPIVAGFGEEIDTTIASTSARYGWQFISCKDTVVIAEVLIHGDSAGLGTVPDFDIQIYHNTTLASAGTALFSSAQSITGTNAVTTGVSLTTFSGTNNKIPPGDHWIYAKTPTIDDKFTGLMVSFKCYYLNAE